MSSCSGSEPSIFPKGPRLESETETEAFFPEVIHDLMTIRVWHFDSLYDQHKEWRNFDGKMIQYHRVAFYSDSTYESAKWVMLLLMVQASGDHQLIW